MRINIATYNIRDGRNNNIEAVCKALKYLNINVAILTETKLGKNTQHCVSGMIYGHHQKE